MQFNYSDTCTPGASYMDEDEVYALDWSPNGRSVATGSKVRTIKIWKH